METLFSFIDPLLLISMIGSLFLFTIIFFSYQFFIQDGARKSVKKRLTTDERKSGLSLNERVENEVTETPEKKKIIGKKVAKKANDFYVNSDPSNVKKLRSMLMQAGFFDPNAVGYFLAFRFGFATVFAFVAGLLALVFFSDLTLTNKLIILIVAAAAGYFLPNFYLSRKAKKIESQNRSGFPDILDLMIVSAEAGLTMEASIERISEEIKTTYPILSIQLNLAALEIRAGKPIDQALRAFGERLRLDEIKGFATMIQQSKELGTSVSDALRVYSEEMRHKRMMKAEEKAYSLPVKMSVPVTLFMLPTVVMIAIIPTIIRFNS